MTGHWLGWKLVIRAVSVTDRPRSSGIKTIGVLVLFVLLSLGMTYPLISKIDSCVFHDLGDPLVIDWTLAWDIHQLSQNPFNLFEANIFYPSRHVLAYSEHFLGEALLAFPLLLFPKFTILAGNVLYLLSFILGGWGGYLFLKDLSGKILPAIIAGLLFAFSPYHLSRLSHLHILSTQWMPFIFLFLHRFASKPSWKNGLLASMFYVLQGLSCNYYAVLLYPIIFLWAVIFLFSRRAFWNWRNLTISAMSTGFVMIILIPFFILYQDLQHTLGFTRHIWEAKVFSAHWVSYLTASQFNRIYGKLTSQFAVGPFPEERCLFPGVVVVILSVVAIFKHSPKTCRLLGGYGAILGFTFLMTFGPRLSLFGREIDGPYRFFFNYFPGWNGMRVPARIHMISTLSLSVLAGLGAASLEGIFKPVAQKIFYSAIGALILLESFSVPLPFIQVPPPAPVYHWLAAQPGKAAVLELPMPVANSERWREASYVYFSIFHWKPLVNGYSSYFPPYYSSLCEVMQGFPNTSSLEAIKKFGVTYVIWHSAQYDSLQRAKIVMQLAATKEVISVVRFGEDWVLTVPINQPKEY